VRAKCIKFFTGGASSAVYFFLFNLFLGMIVFTQLENHTFIDGFYFACVTLTTVGYGDLTFETQAGRVFAIFWIISGTISMARMLSAVIDARAAEVARIWNEKRNKRLLMQRTDISALDTLGTGQVSRLDFLKYKLVALGRCESWQIDDILSQFDALDEDGSGTLEVEDFKKAEVREQEELRRRVSSLRDLSTLSPVDHESTKKSVPLVALGQPLSDSDDYKINNLG